jgi:hypothetical protein
MKSTLSPDRTELKERWAEFKVINPKTRIRDAARGTEYDRGRIAGHRNRRECDQT